MQEAADLQHAPQHIPQAHPPAHPPARVPSRVEDASCLGCFHGAGTTQVRQWRQKRVLMRPEAAFPYVFAAEGAQHPPKKPPRSAPPLPQPTSQPRPRPTLRSTPPTHSPAHTPAHSPPHIPATPHPTPRRHGRGRRAIIYRSRRLELPFSVNSGGGG